MGLGEGFRVTAAAPQISDFTRGLRDTLTANRNFGLQQQDRAAQAVKDFAPLAEKQTIRDTLGNINERDGVQLGLATQQAANAKYTAINNDYEQDMVKLKELGYQANKQPTYYDDNGVPLVDPKMEGIQRAGADLTKMHAERVNALNTDIQTRHAADQDMFNTLTNPKDAEKRLADALMAKGIGADTSRLQARNEMKQYDTPDLTEIGKARLKSITDRREFIKDTPAVDQSVTNQNYAKGYSSSNKSSSKSGTYTPSHDYFTKVGMDQDWSGTTQEEMNSYFINGSNGNYSDKQIIKALDRAKGSNFVGAGKIDEDIFMKELSEMVPTGSTRGNGNGTQGLAVTKRTKGFSDEQRKALRQLDAEEKSILGGSKRKTVKDVLGDFGSINDKRYTDTGPATVTKPKTKGSKDTTKPTVFGNKATPIVNKQMANPKKGSLAAAISKSPEAANAFWDEYGKLSKTKQSKIDEVLNSNESAAKVNKWGTDTAKTAETVTPAKVKNKTEFEKQVDSSNSLSDAQKDLIKLDGVAEDIVSKFGDLTMDGIAGILNLVTGDSKPDYFTSKDEKNGRNGKEKMFTREGVRARLTELTDNATSNSLINLNEQSIPKLDTKSVQSIFDRNNQLAADKFQAAQAQRVVNKTKRQKVGNKLPPRPRIEKPVSALKQGLVDHANFMRTDEGQTQTINDAINMVSGSASSKLINSTGSKLAKAISTESKGAKIAHAMKKGQAANEKTIDVLQRYIKKDGSLVGKDYTDVINPAKEAAREAGLTLIQYIRTLGARSL